MPSIEELRKMVNKLQQIMRIQDWDIFIRIVDKYEMEKESDDTSNYGLSIRYIALKKAEILLNKDHHPEDWYATLIHELKHIQSGDMTNEIKRYMTDKQYNDLTYYEQFIEILAKEFISIYPESKIKEDLI